MNTTMLNSYTPVLQRAIANKDAKSCGKICDTLRTRHGMNYNEISDFACRVGNITPDQWEDLMYDADTADGE